MSFEAYFWESRLSKYWNKLYTNKTTIKRKFIIRCQKVNWEKMQEVSKLEWFEIKDYIREHKELLEKLYELEFNTNIHW